MFNVLNIFIQNLFKQDRVMKQAPYSVIVVILIVQCLKNKHVALNEHTLIHLKHNLKTYFKIL